MTLWLVIAAVGVGCYALKLAGLAAPRELLDQPRVARFADLVPVALLSALIAVQVLTSGRELTVDPARLSGLAAAVLALVLRAPFLVVLIAAAVTTGLVRALV
ncbi:branched-chain amino acid transporter AzlD [Longispora fulva]|uniref:Branched-subunit amino acid transport protein n=1 Tax=Longispora fulva TaxID=619741 RepID=A0A8J7H4F5_9ACTN|nr:AzlD domain-containing protein [Longispora fulva]MBG6141283.1 branched-subunit amino acid transport protein [Longispora fulva]GIG62720.1 branched-chain amino acid transporter AzlD [Longispora fulva]